MEGQQTTPYQFSPVQAARPQSLSDKNTLLKNLSKRRLTIVETLIGSNNLNIYCESSVKSDKGQHLQFL